MIDWTVFWGVVIFATIMGVTPGANNILTFYYALRGDWKGMILFRIGTGITYPGLVVAMVYGLSPVVDKYPWIVENLTYVGVGAMFYIAYQIWTQVPDLSKGGKPLAFSGILGGAILQLINGKTWSIAMTCATLYITPTQPLEVQAFTLWIVFIWANFFFPLFWTAAALWFRKWIMQSNRLVMVNKVMSIALVLTILKSIAV